MTTRNRELASIIDDSGNITTGGNLAVTGNLTQSSSTTTSYSDGLLELNSGAGSNSNDLGLVMERGSTGDNAIFLWDESNDGFAVGTTTAVGTATGNISFSAAPFTAAAITGTILNGSTSVRTPLIEFTDGDDALTIADGGLVTTSTHFSIGGSNNELRFYEGSNYVGFEAPALSADQIWVLPTADGSSGQLLKTDGSGNLSFTDDLTLANASVNNFSGDGSTTGFTLSSTPVTENTTMAYINGVYQFKNTYSVSGTTFTFDAAPANGASIEIVVWSTVAVNVPADSSVTSAKLSGNLTAPGTVTANAGVVVDNITIDGTQIDLSSGDLTLDVAGKILLSADDAGTIQLFDGSLHYGSISEDNSNLIIQSIVQDEDIIFKGDDAGSVITALTLDMSVAGAATFNSQIGVGAAPLQDAKLDLHTAGSTAKPLAIRITNAASTNYAWEIWRDNTNGDLNFGEELNGTDTTRVTFESGGKVGIGTTSPGTPLDIVTALSSDTQSTPETVLTLATKYTSTSGVDGAAGAGPRLEFKIPDDETNPITGAAIAGLKENADDSNANAALAFYISQNDTTLDEAMRIDSNGDVGIGTNDPLNELDIIGGGYAQIRIGSNKTDNTNKTAGIVSTMYTNNSVSFMQGFFQNGDNSVYYGSADASHRGLQNHYFYVNSNYNATSSHTLAMRITSVGHVGIKAANRFYLDYNSIGNGDTYIDEYAANEVGITTGGSRKLAVSGGNLYVSGSVNANHNFSDERLKENIVVIPNALEKVNSLRGITYTRKDDESVGTGLIAQELEKVLPEAVYETKMVHELENPDAVEWKSINYGNTVGLLVEAIKEQQTIIEDLKSRIETLEG